jgi:hypothetical protein
MLSATPTDMGHSLRQGAPTRERKTDRRNPVCAGASPAAWKDGHKENRPGNTEAAKMTAWLREEKPGRYAVEPQFSRRQRIAALGLHRTKLNVVRWQHSAAKKKRTMPRGTIRLWVRL